MVFLTWKLYPHWTNSKFAPENGSLEYFLVSFLGQVRAYFQVRNCWFPHPHFTPPKKKRITFKGFSQGLPMVFCEFLQVLCVLGFFRSRCSWSIWIISSTVKVKIPKNVSNHLANLSGWWFQPLWKICSSKWVHLPQNRGENKKYLSCHHPVSIIIKFKRKSAMLRTCTLALFPKLYLQILEIFHPFFPPFSSEPWPFQQHPFLPRSKSFTQHQKIRSPTRFVTPNNIKKITCPLKKGLYISIGNASSNHWFSGVMFRGIFHWV